jgi:hypothetical protein
MISRIANFRLPATTLHLWRTAAAAELARLPPSLDAAAAICEPGLRPAKAALARVGRAQLEAV